MKKICEYNKCTGCASCVNACPKQCISLKNDKYGETHPEVDSLACINCGLCVQSCPNNVELVYNEPKRCYASWITDKATRKLCASGGIGTILAEYVIIYKKGVVFGTSYDKDLMPITTYSEKLEDLEQFKGSKYVQSYIGPNVFKNVKTFLKNGRYVLYIGTPCQIAGLKTYLRKDYDNLLTVDLICHGVSPSQYLAEEVDEVCKKHKINKTSLVSIRFRGNDSTKLPKWRKVLGQGESNNFAFTLWKNKNNTLERCFWQSKTQNYYLAGFLMGVTLRENCYSCNYARPERVSDITLGDFIGLGKIVPFPEKKEGHVSVVFINTEKANLFYSEVSSAMKELRNVERDYTERLEYTPSLLHPYKRHELNIKFRELYPDHGFIYASRKAMHKELKTMHKKERIEYLKSKITRLINQIK